MEMCRQLQETMNQIAKMAGYQNPEVQAMFEEWSMEIEKEIISQLKEQREVDISSISTKKIIGRLKSKFQVWKND